MFLCDPPAWLFELAGGAITDYEETCIPKTQREAKFTIAALHQWEMGVDDPRCVSSAEEVRVFFLGLPSRLFFSFADPPSLFFLRHSGSEKRSSPWQLAVLFLR